MKKVLIADLYVSCSLQLRNHHQPGVAMSDCCGQPASYGVVMENGRTMWRCAPHKDIRRLEHGPVVTTVLRKIPDEG